MGNPDGNKERDGFADAINRAAFGNERVLLRRRGRAVAAVVPINDLRLLEALENRIDLIEARAALAQANKNGAKPLDESLALYEKGVGALKHCHGILDKAEKRIRLLVKNERGEPVLEDAPLPIAGPILFFWISGCRGAGSTGCNCWMRSKFSMRKCPS